MNNTRADTHKEPFRRGFASSLGKAVRDQPASAALVTMGVAWLFMGGAKVSLFAPSARAAGEALRRAGSAAAEQGKQAGSAIGNGASAAGSGIDQGASAAGSALDHGASAVASRVSKAASRAYGRAETVTHAASDSVSSAGTAAYRASRSASLAARREAEHLQQSVSEFFERQPWAVGALGLVVGAGVAVALPKTRTEREWMGETSDAVKDQAQALLSERLANATHLADRAMEETAREAGEQGLSEEQIADAIRRFREKLTSVVAAAGDSLETEIDKTTDASKR